MTTLYKFLKPNGTTFYAFPGASEDISAAYQNSNYKMYFSKYALLNFPKQNTSPGTQSNPTYFDFDSSFSKSLNATPATTFSDGIVESLRNYVANHEIVIRESRLNNTKYYYDTNALETTSEKIFWKWCKKLNLIDFEPAIPSDEYFSNLREFQSNNLTSDDYFPEFLWKEREIIDWDVVAFYQTGDITYGPLNKLEIEFESDTNLKVGDVVNIYNITNSSIISETNLLGVDTNDGLNTTVLKVIPVGATQGEKIIVDLDVTLGYTLESTGQVRLVYNKLVRYIGEVNGVSNVQEANRSYTEVFANIPDHTGMTPDILFRTIVDANYRPNLTFPIIPNQYQPEIMGAENFNSPIVSNPQNYPGSYFGQFDTLDFTYETENGDELRRSGDYFGVNGDINNPIINSSSLDGINIDFNTSHYVKMNIPNRVVTNFDQFNALEVNNEPPKDFEFNAILWYYTVEDQNGNSRTNLYGISFLDHPDNNPVDEEIGLRFPTLKKLVANGNQDGTAYSFNLNLNFNIINENTIDAYNPEAINSLFSMNLFNEAMKKLSSTNDSFINIISDHSEITDEIRNIKGLLYTQTDINVINTRINNLENLLRLYSSNQMVSSESIEVIQRPGTPPTFIANNIDTQYGNISNYLTSDMYNAQGIIPINISVPTNKSFLVNVVNNDEVEIDLSDDLLTMVISRDLDYKQSIDFIISGNEFSSQNKRLNIYMISDADSDNGELSEVLVLGGLDLPVYYNTDLQVQNSAYLWKDFKFEIDFDQSIEFLSGDRIRVPFVGNQLLINNSIKQGDVLYLNNFFVGTSSVYNFSGQYKVDSLEGLTSSYVIFDVSNNDDVVDYMGGLSLPYTINQSITNISGSFLLTNYSYFSLNKGKKIRLTRVSNSTVLKDRYNIQIDDII